MKEDLCVKYKYATEKNQFGDQKKEKHTQKTKKGDADMQCA